MRMSEVVSTLNMFKKFIIHKIEGAKRTVLTDRGATGGSGTSTGSTFGILCGRNESLISCKKASASALCGSGCVLGMGRGIW